MPRMMRLPLQRLIAILFALWVSTPSALAATGATMAKTKTVFIIVMENHNWDDIKGSSKAPFINRLLKESARAERYFNPPGLHPSEPNYLWLIAGSNHGVKDDAQPSKNGLHGIENWATQMNARGIRWKSYQEDIDGKTCPLVNQTPYAVKHNPFVYFDNLTDDFSNASTTCIAHNRPLSELGPDLAANTVPQFVFITPNICSDMHGSYFCNLTIDRYQPIQHGDTWLSKLVPMIQKSAAYQDQGAIFITWDESEGRNDKPIGLILLSPNAKVGYANNMTRWTHSALLRTVQDIFKLPPLGDAANSGNLADLFK
jgi:hypothetical protein